MQLKSFFMKMTDGNELWINRWIPDSDTEIKGVIQLHHGLAEHSLRYDRLGSILAEHGYVLNAHDMRGHGQTGANAQKNKKGRMGRLAEKKGFDRVVEDLDEMIENLKKEFPGKKVILLGHSFGSFVSQGYIEKYGKRIDGVILSGTAGPQKALVGFGNIFAHILCCFFGPNSVLKLLYKLSFGGYNKRIEHPISDFSWLSKNQTNISMYESDDWCGIPLTTSFYVDMTGGLKKIHRNSNMKKIPRELPLLCIYGEEDPVGGYGKTVNKLMDIYKKNGLKDIQVKSYKDDRHEILNEDDKETVENDILNWLDSKIK